MPLVLWPIQPVSIYRDNKFVNEKDVLQAQRVHSLAQLLTQCSNITSNVALIFSELYDDISKISATTTRIGERVKALRENVNRETSKPYVFKGMKMGWKLNIVIGAPTVHRSTIPEPMDKIYQSCVSMPAFESLEKFNTTGTPCSHKYSNPGFFMQQWINDLDKDMAIKKERRMQRREQKRQTVRISTRVEPIQKTSAKQAVVTEPTKPTVEVTKKEHRRKAPPVPESPKRKVEETKPVIEEAEEFPLMEEPAPIPEPPKVMVQPAAAPMPQAPAPSGLAPPPPPAPAPKIEILEVRRSQVDLSNLPVPPPPPAPSAAKPPPAVPSQPPPAAAQPSGGMDFLSSIRTGKALKKVEAQEEKKVDSYQGNDVASILARRIQLAGDSDSDEESDHGNDDDWD